MSSLWKQHGARPPGHNAAPSTPLQSISWGSSLPTTQPAALNQGICLFQVHFEVFILLVKPQADNMRRGREASLLAILSLG